MLNETMSWNKYHLQSERYAAEAEALKLNGNSEQAKLLYEKAAIEEFRALDYLDESKKRTLGVTAVSAVSLLYKSSKVVDAEREAHRCLAIQALPDFAMSELRAILQTIWNEAEMKKTGIKFVDGQVLVSVKGGKIVRGGAPLDLIIEKVQTVQSYFYRTTELIRNMPHRRRGAPEKGIQDMCRPWLFQAAPGSYQFAVAVEESIQQELFDKNTPSGKEIATSFLSILRSSIEDPENEFKKLVPSEEYQTTFLKLTRNLVPTGKSYSEMEIRLTNVAKSISLVPAARDIIRDTLNKHKKTAVTLGEEKDEKTLQGILRAVHLDQDWLEVTVGEEHKRVLNIGDTVDDLIGPMINRPVLVKYFVNQKGANIFIDIESEG
jgi:hypothetical protein